MFAGDTSIQRYAWRCNPTNNEINQTSIFFLYARKTRVHAIDESIPFRRFCKICSGLFFLFFFLSFPFFSFFLSPVSFRVYTSLAYSRTRVSYTFDSKQASRTCFTRIPSSFSSAVEPLLFVAHSVRSKLGCWSRKIILRMPINVRHLLQFRINRCFGIHSNYTYSIPSRALSCNNNTVEVNFKFKVFWISGDLRDLFESILIYRGFFFASCLGKRWSN